MSNLDHSATSNTNLRGSEISDGNENRTYFMFGLTYQGKLRHDETQSSETERPECYSTWCGNFPTSRQHLYSHVIGNLTMCVYCIIIDS